MEPPPSTTTTLPIDREHDAPTTQGTAMVDLSSAPIERSDRLSSGQLSLPGTTAIRAMPLDELAALIEALLLVATDPPTVNELSAAAGTGPDRIDQALDAIAGQDSRGLVVQRHGDRVQLTTAPRFSHAVRTFLGLDREVRLSSASLETLAIIAYQQPVTRVAIEAVRGVDCSGVISTLHARELIEPVSRQASVGNPFQYGTTGEFLKHFGLQSLADLPPLGMIDGQDGRDRLARAAEAVEGPSSPTQLDSA